MLLIFITFLDPRARVDLRGLMVLVGEEIGTDEGVGLGDGLADGESTSTKSYTLDVVGSKGVGEGGDEIGIDSIGSRDGTSLGETCSWSGDGIESETIGGNY